MEMSKNNDFTTGNLLDYECSLLLRKKKPLLIFTKFYFCNCCLICIKMKTQKIANLLNNSDNESSKFATRKWYIINDQTNGKYRRGNENDSTIKFTITIN